MYATKDIFNEAGRKKLNDDFSSFLNFPEDYKSYLIKRDVKRSNAKSGRNGYFATSLEKNV